MEYASEMVTGALHGINITEVPTTLSLDGRSRPPHVRSWRDGWRHLKFLLMYSPDWFFVYLGMFLVMVGLIFFFCQTSKSSQKIIVNINEYFFEFGRF